MSKKIALWNPYLDIIGGGEKHILELCMYFVENGYELTIFWDKDLKAQLENTLSIELPKTITWLPSLHSYNAKQRMDVLKQFDMLAYVTDGSYFSSSAKHTIAFCMVPNRALYKMTLMNKLKTRNWIWICNSHFTQAYLENWGVDARVVYPVLSKPKYEREIKYRGTSLTFLTVGRFFKHLHSKRHDVAVAWFVNFITQYPEYATSKLILVGGLKKEDQEYYESLKRLSTNYPNVVFKTNITSEELEKLYNRADYYVHFAGWQVNESTHPERTEHLGITPLEAIAHGCVPFCHQSGGIREVIKDHVNGFTFKSLDELSHKILEVNGNEKLRKSIREAGLQTLENKFSSESFRERMDELFKSII